MTTNLLKPRTILAFLFVSLIFSFKKQPPRKPNVVFILTDDQGYGDLSIHGNPHLQTPNLDLLAKQSAQFNRFYVSPLCAPSRASFLSGKYHLRTGVVSVSNGLEVMNSEETTLAEVFKRQGYSTGIFGKWHNGEYEPHDPNSQGFDTFWGFSAGHLTNYFDTELNHNGQVEKTKGYITDVLTDKAIDFMESSKNKPFFCYIPYNAPHSPNQVPDKYFDKYKQKGLNDELSAIYGMVDNVDGNIGRIMKYLKDKGYDKNTIVVFATDNGPNTYRYNADMKGKKSNVDEGGVRVPFFIRWKGRIKPQVQKALAAHIDLLPTIAELCSIEIDKNTKVDGVSFAKSVLSNKQKNDTRAIFSHVAFLDKTLHPFPGSIRTAQYRWVKTSSEVGLYDMIQDPFQKNNLVSTKTEIAESLENQYNAWFADVSKGLKLTGRPIPVGISKRKIILNAHDASFTGSLKFKEGHGWAHDWLVNWSNPTDSIQWNIVVRKAGEYSLSLRYSCPKEKVGSTLLIS
ncbi:MAG: arylsulfatase, partial [Leadbetterella sp.]